MKTAAFARSFWIMFVLIAGAFLLGLHLIWIPEYRKLVPPVRPPVWGKSYVALYDIGADHGNIDFYLFHTGIFGFRQRINQADLLLFGSSHVMFGLSAGQLSQKFSAAEGRPIKVFNVAISGTQLDLIANVVTANHVHDKQAVFDLFALEAPPPDATPRFMLGAISSDLFEAYVQVGKCWVDFWRDWFLDSLLPNLRIGNRFYHTKVFVHRRFLKFTATRDWNNGDVNELWYPPGDIFPASVPKNERPIDNTFRPYSASPNSGVGQHLQNSILDAQHIQPIYTLIPFDGSNLGVVPADVHPYVPMSTDGLFYFDGSHLTGKGRDAATEKLFEGMEKLGIHIGSSARP